MIKYALRCASGHRFEGWFSSSADFDRQREEAGATVPDNLCLSEHTSRWNMNIYLAVDRDVPGAENVVLSGSYFSRVYEGPFQNTRKWCEDFARSAADREMPIQKEYMWYTTCPRCAKKYGENYVALFGRTA